MGVPPTPGKIMIEFFKEGHEMILLANNTCFIGNLTTWLEFMKIPWANLLK